MQTRKSLVAGQFYPDGQQSCIQEIEECLQARTVSKTLPEEIIAGIVPHAGWTFSGSLAALVFAAIKQQNQTPDTFVIFGAAHSYFGPAPAVCEELYWETPLGRVRVDRKLAETLVEEKVVVDDSTVHRGEHSIEVQVPFVQHLFADAEILPIIVPPSGQAVVLGEAVGDIVTSSHKRIISIGSTDLTHYGPRYGFTPMGTGPEALDWADRVNDQQFIDLALRLDAQGMLASAAEKCNACGAGAAAAAVAVAKKTGRTKGVLLAHTNSNEVMLRKMGATSPDSVGYAAIVF